MKLSNRDCSPVYINSRHIMYVQEIQKGDEKVTQIKLINGEQLLVRERPWYVRFWAFVSFSL